MKALTPEHGTYILHTHFALTVNNPLMKKKLSLQYKILLALENKFTLLFMFLNKSEKGQKPEEGKKETLNTSTLTVTHRHTHTNTNTQSHTYRTAEKTTRDDQCIQTISSVRYGPCVLQERRVPLDENSNLR